MDCSTQSIPAHHQFPDLLKLMSIESVMPSNHLILCRPLLLPSVLTSIRVFSNESALHSRWPKYWSFSFSISPSNEYSGLISFRIECFDFLESKGLSSLSTWQFISINSLVLGFLYARVSQPYMSAGKTIGWNMWTVVGRVVSLLFNMPSMFVTDFLRRNKCLLISWLQSPSAVILV